MIKAVIFDCFGVLVEDALGAMRDKLHETDPDKYEEAISILHASHRGLITPAESNTKIAGLLGLSEQDYRQQLNNNEVKNIALLEYIKKLKENYKTAILSNISTGGIYRRFNEKELELFDTVVTSGELGFAKPE
ncbi:MAG: HAD family hydrolase, partial [Candidatus Saccharimonadales bacterium]